MLIFLDKSISESNTNLSDEEKICLEYIAESVKLRKHVVIGDTKTLNTLSHIDKLNIRTKLIFKKLSCNRPQIAQIFDYVNVYIKVRRDIKKIERSREKNCDIINVPLSFFDNTSKVETCYLLCEDLSDCDFYINLTKFVKKELINNFIFDLIPSNGGGTNSADSYCTILNKCFPCISIVDSDKTSQTSEYKETASKLKAKYENYSTVCLTNLHILEVREKENLLTPHIYQELSNNKYEYKILKLIYENPKYRDICYFGDVKSGLRFSNDMVKDYIIQELEHLVEHENVDKQFLNKVAICLKNSGYGTKFTQAVNEYLSKNLSLSQEENNDIVICGVRKLFEQFNQIVLKGNIDLQIENAKLKYETNPNIDFFKEKYLSLEEKKIIF